MHSQVMWSSKTSPSEAVDLNAKVGLAYALPLAVGIDLLSVDLWPFLFRKPLRVIPYLNHASGLV